MYKKLVLGFGLALAAMTAQASAATIFSDQFNRGTTGTVGNGWTELGDAGGVGIQSNVLYLYGSNGTSLDAGIAQLAGLSAVGYTGITLAFDWLGIGTEFTDHLYAQWKLQSESSSQWHTLATIALGDTSGGLNPTGLLALGAAAAGQLIDIRLYTDVSRTDEGAWIDNVVLAGTPVSPVPLPGALPLFASGLVGLGWLRKRRKCPANLAAQLA